MTKKSSVRRSPETTRRERDSIAKKRKETTNVRFRRKTEKAHVILSNMMRTMGGFTNSSNSSSEQLRDMNKECGYPDDVTLDAIYELYEREGVAQRVVHVYPVETWKTAPTVYDRDAPEVSPFETAFSKFVDKFNLWSVLERADKLSGIGSYGIILIGVNDGKKLEQPISGIVDDTEGHVPSKMETPRPLEVMYLRAFDQKSVTIDKLVNDPSSPRYGRVEYYTIDMTSDIDSFVTATRTTNKIKVHWSRVIHLADNLGSSTLAGSPRIKPAYNRILDLIKVLGGSSEMFWKGGFPGISFELQPGMEDFEFDEESFKAEVEAYANGLQRYLRIVGLTAKSLTPQVADPTPQVHAGLDQICITINCPKRIFLGTESAHLASTQDQKTWSDRINGRRMQYAVPYLSLIHI